MSWEDERSTMLHANSLKALREATQREPMAKKKPSALERLLAAPFKRRQECPLCHAKHGEPHTPSCPTQDEEEE